MTSSSLATTVDSGLDPGLGSAMEGMPLPAAAAPATPAVPAVEPLRARVMRGSAWSIFGYGASLTLRFTNNVILTWLILQSELGLMLIVSVVLQGLQMFSDLGIGPSIIQHQRGNDREFLNTAWTLHIVRGVGLWLGACLFAWPVAAFYNEPRLILLIAVCGFGNVISGFTSTSLITLGRQLHLGRLTLMEIGVQIAGICVTVIWATTIHNDIWALIAGNFATVILKTAGSFRILSGHRNALAWNRQDARDMFRFGRWIFLSTALTFFAMQADKLLFGKLIGTSTLMVYNIAAQFAFMPSLFIKRISGQITFPMMAEIARERPKLFGTRLRQSRIVLIGGSFAVLLPLMFFGHRLIDLVYPNQYQSAAWMLRILTVSAMAGVICSTYGSALLALGKSFQSMLLLITQLMFLLPAAILGNYWGGQEGFIIGLAVVEWLNYPITAMVVAKLGVWEPEVDFPAIAVSAAAIGAAVVIF